MKNIAIFTACLLAAAPAWSGLPQIDSFDLDSLQIANSYCGFEEKPNRTVFASDWITRAWMKIDGTMTLFVSTESEAERRRNDAGKHWRDTFRADDMTVQIDLVQTRLHDDTASYKGHITFRRGGGSRRLIVTGGCAA